MSETVLITGGAGFIGIELANSLIAEGHRIVVFDLKPPETLLQGNGAVSYVSGDITNFSQVLNAVRDFRPEVIIHLAAILSAPSENNPWASISVNGMGTYHILEAARLFDSKRVILTSSLAVYVNPERKFEVVTEDTPQRSVLIYGVTKVFSELLGLYYHKKFGLDVRGIRLPVLIGPNVNSPGFGQYNSRLVEAAILGKPFEVTVPEDTVIPLLYVKDALRSLVMLNNAPEDGLVTRIYNVGQIMPPPRTLDLVNAVRKHYPEAKISFNPDPLTTEVNKNTPREIRCDEAQKEWGWYVSYSLDDMVKDFITTFTQ
ncbi:MAG: NAD-dependent epimerase/dehydratase family protein [Desulfomonilaceae bacterium]